MLLYIFPILNFFCPKIQTILVQMSIVIKILYNSNALSHLTLLYTKGQFFKTDLAGQLRTPLLIVKGELTVNGLKSIRCYVRPRGLWYLNTIHITNYVGLASTNSSCFRTTIRLLLASDYFT